MSKIEQRSNHEQRDLRRHFLTALYDTLESVVSPTPYMEITEGETVDVRLLDGKGRLPSPNSTEINVLDLNVGSMFFDDFHILYQGETGRGKTFTSNALFDAVFGPDGHYTVNLSGGVLGSSVLEPFTTTTLEHGIPKTRIDHEKCRKYGALFIDEINRGESQEVFQVVDGKIHVNGESARLGINIPGTDRYKSLAIIAAMNPADAQHSSAVELDIAGENRFLKFDFPNGVTEAGSTQLEKKVSEKLHDKFWTEFRRLTGRKGGWRENYPVVTDPEQISDVLDGATREFIDVALGYVGTDPKETYARNADLIRQAGLEPAFSIRDDNEYKKILKAQGTLKHGFVRRDLKKIRDLARLIGFIKGVKRGDYDATVGLNDVVASMGVVLESKAATGTDHGGLIVLVNDARKAYTDMHRQANVPAGYGLRQAVWQAALYAGNEHGYEAYINTLNQGIAQLNVQASTNSQAVLKSRIVADLAVLDHFSKAHKDEVEVALKKRDRGIFESFGEMYDRGKSKSSIYEHRLGSIMR